jgi:glycogen operon protein
VESQQGWRRCVDTALASPDDFCSLEKAPSVAQTTYVVQPRSLVFLMLPLQVAEEKVSQAR